MAITGPDGQPILRFGVVGLGQAAAQALPALAAHPNIRITAAADLRPELLETFTQQYGGETYRSLEELAASPNVDVVHISTPHNLHVEHTMAAVAEGKHVVLEKPMALSLEDCDRMIEAVEKAGVFLVVDRGSHGFDPPVVSCERGDMIPTSDGITLYDDEGKREIEVPIGRHLSGYAFEEMYDAVVNKKPIYRDGRWGKATLEVALAMVESARERREVQLKHQCPTPD